MTSGQYTNNPNTLSLSLCPSHSVFSFQSCVLFLCLLPFFLSSAAYFHLWLPDPSPSVVAAVAKSVPVISLALVVLSYNGLGSLLGVAGGLLFSAGGDFCLVWNELFLHGNQILEAPQSDWLCVFVSSRNTYSLHSESICKYALYMVHSI